MTLEENQAISRLSGKVDGITEQLTGISGELVGIKEQFRACNTMVMRHDKALHGNGAGGLLSRMAKSEAELDGQSDRVSVPALLKLMKASGGLVKTVLMAVGAALGAYAAVRSQIGG